ncbi:MAG: amidohydrolase family protein [Saprospiraceae bacterium]
MIIDSHQHFWRYHPISHGWINDQMSMLKKDFLPEDLQKVYLQNGVDACVAVQADQSEAETDFLLQLAENHDFIKGVVGWVDLRAENIEERLAYYADYPKLKGVRHVVQDEADPNFMLRDDFQRGLELLHPYNLTYDLLIFPTQLPAALETVESFPDLNFVVDHIAKPYIKAGKIDDWAKYMQQIASFPNVMCKLSGMITEANWTSWQKADFKPYLDVVFEAFGTHRLLFGSDWPVCLLAGNYTQVKGIIEDYISDFNPAAQQDIWANNAMNFYQL